MRLRLPALLLVLHAPLIMAQESAFERGRRAYQEDRLEDAIRLFEEAVRTAPDSAQPHAWLARSLMHQTEHVGLLRKMSLGGRARSELRRALEIDSNLVDAHEDLANWYLVAPSISGGGVDKAREEAEVVRRLDPYRGGLLRARVEGRKGDPAAAQREYTLLTLAHPDSAAPYFGLGRMLERRGDIAGARIAYETSRRLNPAYEAAVQTALRRLP